MRPLESMVRSFGWLYFLPSKLSVRTVSLPSRSMRVTRRERGSQATRLPLAIEEQAVGAGVFAVDAWLAVEAEAVMWPLLPLVRTPSLRMPGGAFAGRPSASTSELRAGREDRLLGYRDER